MMDVGRLCMKVAGRDAGKTCVIVDVLDKNTVLIDGQTRRRKCNLFHLEPLREVLKIKKGCSHEEVVAAFKKLGLEVLATKPRKAGSKPSRARKTVVGPTAPAAPEGQKAEKPAKEKKAKKQ
jgi:large subunit ribosomal protein L14e